MGIYKSGSGKVIYPSLDGNCYDNPFEQSAADTRYRQQQNIYNELKRQNDLLENKNKPTYYAPSKYELERSRLSTLCSKGGLNYDFIKSFISDVDTPRNIGIKTSEQHKQLTNLKNKIRITENNIKAFCTTLIATIVILTFSRLLILQSNIIYYVILALVEGGIIHYTSPKIIKFLTKIATHSILAKNGYSNYNEFNKDLQNVESIIDTERSRIIDNFLQFRRTHYNEDAEYILNQVNSTIFDNLSSKEIKNNGTLQDYASYFKDLYGIKINIKGS